MNRVSQLFTKKFIATALLSFNGIDTYFQTFRYFFPVYPSILNRMIRRCSGGSSSIWKYN